MIITQRTYGFHEIGGLVERPGGAYQAVRLGLDGGDLVAVDAAGAIAMRAEGHRGGWYVRRFGEAHRLAARWQRAGGALLGREQRA